MDAVYILGTGSLSQNEELRYSVRSLARHMLDLRDVYIVGEPADFLPSVIHIPAQDSYPRAWQNALHKTRLACALEQISDEFLLMNDDFFMLSDFLGSEFPFYALKNSDGGPNGRHSFAVHCPIRLKKEWYLKMPISVELSGHRSPRSFYANFFGAPPVFVDDFILRPDTKNTPLDLQLSGRDFFSIDNACMLDRVFVSWLSELYSEPSRFELEIS